MTEETNRFGSLIAIAGQGNNISYLIQARNVNDSKFKTGEYGFYIPGGCSIPGGSAKPNEELEETVVREMEEELGINIASMGIKLDNRFYNWGKMTVGGITVME